MTEVQYVKDLFERPAGVSKGDFVLKLTEGVRDPQRTVADYVATPSIVDAFDRALGLVGSALDQGRSKGAYLHGSFGSGKSHFMAVLSLLIQGNEHAWAKPALHSLREKHRFAGGKRLLELHFHMIGKEGLESALLGQYVQYVREHHPKAPTPALFADEALFENARSLLGDVGDETFFSKLNSSEDDAGAGAWGDFAGGQWDRERFEHYASSGDPKQRAELFDALAKVDWFSAYTQQGAYLDLDSGLAELSRHAKGLGYAGVVLFLDELILWLAHRASEKEWMHDQVQKMVKLVEAQDSERAIPIVSFIARQRDLADMVGDDYAGLESKRLRDSLKHWEGRFDTIGLEDTNLPAIVEQRVLKPKDGAGARIDAAFEQLKRGAGQSWRTLLGQWDQQAFRSLYPFSPALIDALVALSSYLQRERTAIKLLMELLVFHIEDLKVGEVVRVGDLFDALIDGTEAADGAPRARFNAARELYTHKLLPMIQQQNGTTSAERCQRLRKDRKVRLGCAGCPEKQCRTDNRLAKTLLIASLVPNVKSLSDLTASRLVALNHGSIKVPIPGTEAAQAAAKLKKWSAELTQIQLGGQADPQVRVALESVDAVEILKRAGEFDNLGARQRVLRGVLFGALGVDEPQGGVARYKLKNWRGTTREGALVFGNVRKLHDDQLRCGDDEAFRLVLDYPFDEPEHRPQEDEDRVQRMIEADGGGWTLVWLPSFFSTEINGLLGELTILETMLSSRVHTEAHTSHLPVDQQVRARTDLENLRMAKKSRLEGVLEQAYGLKTPNDEDLDPSLRVEQHLRLLKPGASLQSAQPSSLTTALDAYLPALLDARWPRHPELTKPLTKARQQVLVDKFARLLDQEDKELALDRAELEELRGTLAQLGIVQVTERVVRLAQGTGPLVELEKQRSQQGVDTPSVAQMRGWVDPSGRMGLLPEVEDLLLRCYARAYARTFVRGDRPYLPKAGVRIADDVVLEKPPLPTPEQWMAALSLAGPAFGVTLAGKALHADNLKAFEAKLGEALAKVAGPAAQLPSRLSGWLSGFGVAENADRMLTARSGDALCAALSGKEGKTLVEAMAAFHPETSARALGASLASGAPVVRVLGDPLVQGPLERLRGDLAEQMGAAELLEQVSKALRQDELNQALPERLKQLAVQVGELGAQVAPPPPPPQGKRLQHARFADEGGAQAAARLRELADALEQDSGRTLRGSLELWESGE